MGIKVISAIRKTRHLKTVDATSKSFDLITPILTPALLMVTYTYVVFVAFQYLHRWCHELKL